MWRNMETEEDPVNTVVDIAKALADTSRVRALAALRRRELCVCQITELLGLAPSTVSKHMTILRQAGLVESVKEGRWVHYRRPSRPAAAVRNVLEWVDAAVTRDPAARADARRLREILKTPLEDLCRTS
jgi:DNA-binding transcriptional ArsR family regulator